eukprot:g570.t1
MENLVTITAAPNCRHFSLNGADKTLVLRFVKLVGGDARSAELYQDGGSIYAVTGVEIYIYSSTIVGNVAEKGGAVFVYEGQITVFRSSFVRNSAEEKGGAIMATRSNVALTECEIHNNTMTATSQGPNGGGGIFLVHSTNLLLRKTSFASNSARNGQGHDIMTSRDDNHGTPMISIVNSYFKDKHSLNVFWNSPINSGCNGCVSTIGCSPGNLYTSVCAVLESADLKHYEKSFSRMGIVRSSDLQDVDDEDLEDLGLSRFQRKKLRRAMPGKAPTEKTEA